MFNYVDSPTARIRGQHRKAESQPDKIWFRVFE
jgi:hypothetical protein